MAYIRSLYGVIDLTAVVFFLVPQINSGVLLWMFKFGRILRVFKLLRFVDEADRLLISLRECTAHRRVHPVCCDLAGVPRLPDGAGGKQPPRESISKHWARGLLGRGDHDHRGLRRCGAANGARSSPGCGGDASGFGIIAIPTGIVSYEAIRQGQNDQRRCSYCGFQGHRPGGDFCDRCGTVLPLAKR